MLTGSWERLLQPGSNGQTVNCCSAKEGEHVFAPCPIKQALLLSITLLVAVLFVQVEEVTEQNSLCWFSALPAPHAQAPHSQRCVNIESGA